jgi:hypothetical protein
MAGVVTKGEMAVFSETDESAVICLSGNWKKGAGLQMESPFSFLTLRRLNLPADVPLRGLLMMKALTVGLQDWLLALTGLLLFFNTGHLVIALVNWPVTLLGMPHPLPRMDFSEGIPTEFRTLAVVPTMLTGAQNIAELIEAMGVRFLANRDDNLHFALLTDFHDADTEAMPEDEDLLRLVKK